MDKVNQKRTVAAAAPNSLLGVVLGALLVTCLSIGTRSTFTYNTLLALPLAIQSCLQEPATSGSILLQFSRTTSSSSQPYLLLSVSSFLILRSSWSDVFLLTPSLFMKKILACVDHRIHFTDRRHGKS